jgi:signal transduction histidine kinase
VVRPLSAPASGEDTASRGDAQGRPLRAGRWRPRRYRDGGLVIAVYAVIVLGIGALTGRTRPPSLGLSVLATALVALGFEPVRRRLLGLRASSPYQVMTRLTEQIEKAPSGEDVLHRMARVLAEGTGAQRVEVWLTAQSSPQAGETMAAAWPPDGEPLPHSGPGIRSHPVTQRAEVLGRLVLREGAGEPLTPLEDKLFADLARQAGPVMRNVRLMAELEERVRETARRAEELRASRERIVAAHDRARRTLERDIHDGAQQHLVALAVNLRLVRTILGRDVERARAMLPAVRTAAVATIDNLTELSKGLYPRLLAEVGLDGALGAATETAATPVQVRAHDLGRYSPELEAAVYFCALEAVQNATKHARATLITVTLTGTSDFVELVVADDGVGFQPDEVPVRSGLANMRDRLEAVGGTVDISSGRGEGTTVTATVPAALLIAPGVR